MNVEKEDVESVKELVVCVRDLTIAFRAFIPPMTSPTSDHSVDVTRHQLSASTPPRHCF